MGIWGGSPIAKIDVLKYSTRSESIQKARTGEYDRKKEKVNWHRRMFKWLKGK